MSTLKRILQSDDFVCSGVRGLRARELDQFFTSPAVAALCVSHFQTSLSQRLATSLVEFDVVLEPSFGEGSFVDAILSQSVPRTNLLFIDIDARDEAHRGDFLAFNVPENATHCKTRVIPGIKQHWAVVGNPPFGKNSSLAISFFNHAAKFADVIAFVVPRTFCKMSVHDKLDRALFLMD